MSLRLDSLPLKEWARRGKEIIVGIVKIRVMEARNWDSRLTLHLESTKKSNLFPPSWKSEESRGHCYPGSWKSESRLLKPAGNFSFLISLDPEAKATSLKEEVRPPDTSRTKTYLGASINLTHFCNPKQYLTCFWNSINIIWRKKEEREEDLYTRL